MKKDFVVIQNPFYAMDRINGLGFSYKDGDIPSLGFKAQEIEQIFPFLVEETDGIKYVSYSPLIAVNWEATKELKKRHDALVERVEKLETMLHKKTRSTRQTPIRFGKDWLKKMLHSPKRVRRQLRRVNVK